MTQILNIPQIDGSQTSFSIVKNAAFSFSIAFPYPAGPQSPIVAVGVMTSGSATITGLPTAIVSSLVTGQPTAGYGIPAGTTIAGIPTVTSVTLSASVTQSSLAAGITFQPLPLDLTGISFLMQIRSTASDPAVLLGLSTANGMLVNGAATGVLSCMAPISSLAALPLSTAASPLVTDIVASANDGGPINLMAQNGPATVIVQQGVTRT